MLTSRHILVAGGGGSANTGIKNGFEIFELSHDGNKFIVEEATRHETGTSVVMNCAIYSDIRKSFVLVGQENYCQLYNVSMNVTTPEDCTQNENVSKEGENSVHKRRGSSKTKSNANTSPKVDNNSNSFKKLELKLFAGDSIQTDFGTDDPIQRVVRISNSGKLVATAGTDGHVRLWSFPSFSMLHDIDAHSKELDDLDFSPDDKWIVSISKDATGKIWDCATGKKVKDLTWEAPDKIKFLFKRSRFSQVEGDKKKSRLFVIANPARRCKLSSFLQLWNPQEGTVVRSWPSNESLSALAVSDDGRFVAAGTMFTGSVDVFIAFSLQRVLHVPGAHSMFVTGLSFLPSLTDCSLVTGSCIEAAVVSISVDNQICIHSVEQRGTMPSWVAILLIIIVLFCTFVICSYFDL